MILEYFKIAIKNLFNRKLRSFLTIIGIVIGIVAVVGLISVGQGMQNAINEQFQTVGQDRIVVTPGGEGFTGTSPVTSEFSADKLYEHDLSVIKSVKGVYKATGAEIELGEVKFDNTIDYFNVDVDTEISEKQHIAAEMVTTPYLLLIGDDDFPLKSTIEDILIELEKDKSIVAAFGQRVAITQIDNKTSGFKWVKSCPNYSGISITNSNALDRMRKQPIPMWQQYPNSVFRTKPYQKAFKMVGKLEHTQYAEFFTQSFILSYGKWVKYNKLFSVCHQESKFCRFKDRYLFPYYIGKNGSVLSGISQNKWSKTVSLLCDLVGKEIAAISQQDSKDISFQIRKIYYSKLVYYLECNNSLSNNLIDSDSTTLKIINNALRKIGKFYWTIVLYDRSGGIYEFIIFLFGFFREIIKLIFLLTKISFITS